MQTSSYYSFAQSLPTSLNRIKYELLTIIYKALYGLTPSYLINIHVYHSPTCSLCWPPCCYSNMSSMFLIRAFLFGVLFPRNSLFFFFGCSGSLWLQLSLVAASGDCSRYCARASRCGSFSCCRAQVLGSWASVVETLGLSSCSSQALECVGSHSCGAQALIALQQVESSQTRNWIHVPCIGRQTPIHCTTRKVQ